MEQFYRPLLGCAVRYDRAVGYFSSSTLRTCATELRGFVGRNGRIRLVVGCLVSKADIEALLQQGLAEDAAEKIFLRDEFLRRLDEIERSDRAVAQAFARLVAAGVAELRFAFRKDGIYHEKFGIFEDGEGVKIAFIGSINETASALTRGVNHESFSVYQSTEPMFYAAYGYRLEEKFEELWNGRTVNTRVVPLDQESLERVKAIALTGINEPDQTTATDSDKRLPAAFSLRPYQLDAIKAWQDQGFKGILSMATGTGKTLTAIAAVKLVKAKITGAAVVITVPYQNLAVQWLEALRDQGLDAFGVFDSHTNWYDRVKTQFSAARYSEAAPMACLVCVNASFKDERFQNLLALLEHSKEANHLLVVDECHHFNKPEHLSKLSDLFTLRLGLSATPYDQFSDVDEGQHLARYFGKIAFEFPLRRAIQEGFLTKYRYHMFRCKLDADETDRYAQLTHEIIKIAGSDERFSPQTLAKVQPKLLARARIVGAAKDKLHKLQTHLHQLGLTPYTLFYCGDGAVEDEGEWNRQIEVVSQMLHQLGWRTSRITAEESLKTREQLLDMLRNRSIDAVVSIKVLDEGIDVPACQSAYLLASQSSNRQWIQRRGRVLRLSEGKKMADIYDFLVLGGTSEARSLKSLARKELKRAQQFGVDAFNAEDVMKQLSKVQEELGIKIEEQK
jgi:superfamily II DNA or RNA helicase